MALPYGWGGYTVLPSYPPLKLIIQRRKGEGDMESWQLNQHNCTIHHKLHAHAQYDRHTTTAQIGDIQVSTVFKYNGLKAFVDNST